MTTLVKHSWFGAGQNDTDAQMMANHLAVTPEYFAEVSCEGDRLFGVVTLCKRESCAETCETVLNECARKNIWQYAYMVQQELEASLGWTLAPTYVTETIPWDGHSRLSLTFGGVEKLNVVEAVEIIDEDVTYNPYVHQDITVAVVGESYVEVLVPFTYLSMPEGVMFRNPNTGKSWAVEEITGYPQIREVLGTKYWVLAINEGNATAGDTVDVLDCLWGYIDEPTGECTGDIAVVYPDSVQTIPIEKTETDRWYIKHRNMVRQEYQGDEIDLTKFQVHKLYDVVDIACFTETCSLPVITKKCTNGNCDCIEDDTPCQEVTADACATLINAEFGIVDLTEVEVIVDDEGAPVLDAEGCPTFRQEEDCTTCEYTPFKVTISYKTNPSLTSVKYTSSVETLRRAIAARVAAEVNLINCGCIVECGFFKDMRVETNTTVFTRSGSTIVSLRYGNKMGQQVFANALQSAPRNQRVGQL